MVKIISISLTDEEKAFLDLMEMSPTGLMKQKISEVREHSRNFNKKIEDYEKSFKKYQNELQRLIMFLDSKGLYDESVQYVLEEK